ncbi:MAG: hypothetical protein RI988_4053 [Pseudomonadota bacterium]|jgi:uncharacterized protein YajQ (UPF0234 family)
MPSFDAVLEPDLVELRNAVDQASKEVANRFDFKGTSARLELADKGKSRELTLYGDTDFQIGQVREVLVGKLAKRGVDVRFLDFSARIEKIGGDKVKQAVVVKTGIDADNAKAMQSAIKQSKLKVQAQIQGDVVRVSGAKRDDLQLAMRHLRSTMSELPLSFTNFRD